MGITTSTRISEHRRPNAGGVTAFVALTLALGALAFAPRAEALVYWAADNTIDRATLDGKGAHEFISGVSNPCGVAVSDTHIYWANRDTNQIARAKLDGSGVDQSFIGTVGEPCGVAVNRSFIYWAAGDAVGRANLSGTGPNHTFIDPGGGTLCGVALSTAEPLRIFWADQGFGRLGRAEVNGTGVFANWSDTPGIPCGVAVGAHVFWADQGLTSIGRIDTSGLNPIDDFIDTGFVSACGVAVNATHVYWGQGAGGDGIGRSRLDASPGSAAQDPDLIQAPSTCGIALDDRSVPSKTLKLGKAKLNKKKGTAKLTASVAWPGKLKLSGKGVKKKTKRPDAPKKLKLAIKPNGETKAALNSTGKAKVKVKVTHRPDGGAKKTKRKSLTLIQK